MSKKDTQLNLLEHSKAKVDLYTYYLSIYLNILNRSKYINKIKLYDLFAGEGIYENNQKGSALKSLEIIQKHFNENEKTLKIDFLLNDFGKSEIEPQFKKIERVKRECEKYDISKNVKIDFSSENYNDLITKIIPQLNSMSSIERALLLLDPFGYKDIRINELKEMLANNKTELVLFLPIDQMYRFVEKIKKDRFPGSFQLERFMNDLYPKKDYAFNSPKEFIFSLEKKMQEHTSVLAVDAFTIEKERNKFYSLFYFTNNETGLEKWLESKWKLDKNDGEGYRFDGNICTLFSLKKINYEKSLIDFLKEINEVTNQQIWDFGLLKNKMLSKHSNEILKKFSNNLNIEPLDNKTTKKNSFYIGNKERKVSITWIDKNETN